MRKFLLAALAAAFALGLWAEAPSAAGLAIAPPSAGTVAAWSPLPALDDLAPSRFDEGLDGISTGLALAAMALPAAIAFDIPKEKLAAAGLAYAGSIALSYGAMELMKIAIPRPRPYASSMDGLGADVIAEAFESFPSRHSALAFSAATALAVISARAAPDSAMRPWLIGGSFALATGTAVLRVASGAHFPTDVIIGAALGAGIGGLCGLLVPIGDAP